ncbi:MAG: hypothetical protein B6U73_02350 [Desulfurococcales archaeon ex4484_204]|nr:MAG: hypothetical protein B6U73_02350 [Desulfurococcales archaeon ex4484_204]
MDEDARVNLVLSDNNYVEDVKVKLIVNPSLDEALISDQLIDALGIIVISFGKGLWRYKEESEGVIRKSA